MCRARVCLNLKKSFKEASVIKNNKLIVILGPTASGKTDLAIALAKKFNGELISADSRQVYRKMNIGTGKDRSYPQHLIDLINPNEQYSVAQFQKDAYKIIYTIYKKKKIPIMVGGSGLYIDAVIKGFRIPKTDLALRESLEKLSTQELLDQLKSYDKIAYQKIDHNNRRRILRALESSIVNRRPFSECKAKKPNFDLLLIGINMPREELYNKIDQRVDKRIEQGMIEEVEDLMESGVSYERLQSFGLEYRYISQYLQNVKCKMSPLNADPRIAEKIKIMEEEQHMIQNLKFKIHAFARRQLTWFRRNKDICWVNGQSEAERLVKNFLCK